MELDRVFLKQLWDGKDVICPRCKKGILIPLHKRRKDRNDWQCPDCKEVYRTMTIFHDILKHER